MGEGKDVVAVEDHRTAVRSGPVRSPGRTSTEWDLVVTRDEPGIRTVVAEHDPVSRRVLCAVLSRSERLDVVAALDSHTPVGEWPLSRVQVVVVDLTALGLRADPVPALIAQGIRVLLIGVDWSRATVEAAISAGVTGCLVKDPDLTGIVGGVHAVAGGNMVLSPELLAMHLPWPRAAGPGGRDGGNWYSVLRRLSDREREVLALLGEGMSTAEAAKRCGVSAATIKSHVSHALAKLGARNRLEAVLMVKDAVALSQ